MKNISEITQEDICVLMGWFGVYSNEVDISETSMELFKRIIEPNLPPDYKGWIQQVYEQYNNQ